MHPNRETIESFYRSFQARDAAAMGAWYADGAEFSDPVFPRLDAFHVRAMWKMLAETATDLALTYDAVEASEDRGTARWIARYTFSRTGRRVTNVIQASFEFRDGKIVRHTDRFDFWRWSRQALGPAGLLLGWMPALQRKVQRDARARLEAYVAKLRAP